MRERLIEESRLRRLLEDSPYEGPSGLTGTGPSDEEGLERRLAGLLNALAPPAGRPGGPVPGESAAVAAFRVARAAERERRRPADVRRRRGGPSTTLGIVTALMLGGGIAVAAGGSVNDLGHFEGGRGGAPSEPSPTAPAEPSPSSAPDAPAPGASVPGASAPGGDRGGYPPEPPRAPDRERDPKPDRKHPKDGHRTADDRKGGNRGEDRPAQGQDRDPAGPAGPAGKPSQKRDERPGPSHEREPKHGKGGPEKRGGPPQQAHDDGPGPRRGAR